MGFVVDSDVLINIERRGSSVADLAPRETLAISAMSVSELSFALYRAESAERQSQREAFVLSILSSLLVLDFDLAVARTHARIWAELAGIGQMIGAHDLIIAATALHHGHGVITNNVRHFGRIAGLDVRQPDR